MKSQVTIPSSNQKNKRVEYIDLLRGWAVIVMIETHVMNATLSPDIISAPFFEYLKFCNGLVAPSFLFASGLAYAITTRRKIQDYLDFGPKLLKNVNRLFFVLAIGYILHLPKFSFGQLVNETSAEEWKVFYQVDVLQCIAVSLLFMQGLLLLLRTEKRLYNALLLIGCGIVFVTPVIWGIDFWKFLPGMVAEYFNGRHLSLFPLFPWSAFVFAGAITGHFYSRAKEETSDLQDDAAYGFMNSLLWIGGSAILFSIAIEPLARSLYPVYEYWLFSPSFFFLRLGLVILLCWLMYIYEHRKGDSINSPITLIGRESLFVYVAHLFLIFGKFGKFNLVDAVGHSFGYIGAGILTAILLVTMYVTARMWGSIKKNSPRLHQGLNWAALALLLGVFFFGPGE